MPALARLSLSALCLFAFSCADSGGAASTKLPPAPSGLPSGIPDGAFLELDKGVRPVHVGEILRFDLPAALPYDSESPLLTPSTSIPVVWLAASGGDAVLFSQAELPEAKTLLSLVPHLDSGAYTAVFDLGLIRARILVEIQDETVFSNPQTEISTATDQLEQRLADLNQSIAVLTDGGLAAAMTVLHGNAEQDLQDFKAALAAASFGDLQGVAEWLHANRDLIAGLESGDAGGQLSPQEAQGYHDWEANLDLAQELGSQALARIDSGLLSLWVATESPLPLLTPVLELLEIPALIRSVARLEIGEGALLVNSSLGIPVFPKSLELKLAEVSAFHLSNIPEGETLAFGTGSVTPVTLEGISTSVSSASRGMRHPRVRLLLEDIDDAIECLGGEGLLYDGGGALDADILDLSDQLLADLAAESEVPVLHNLNSPGIDLSWSNPELTFFPLVGVNGGNSVLALLLAGDSQVDILELFVNANRLDLDPEFRTSLQVSVEVNAFKYGAVSAALDAESNQFDVTIEGTGLMTQYAVATFPHGVTPDPATVTFSNLPVSAPSPLKLVLPYSADPAHYVGGRWKIYAWLRAVDGSIGPEAPEFASVRYHQRHAFNLPPTTSAGGAGFSFGPFQTNGLHLVLETREIPASNSVELSAGWPPLLPPPFAAIYTLRSWDSQGTMLNIWSNGFNINSRIIPRAEFDQIDSITIHYDNGVR